MCILEVCIFQGHTVDEHYARPRLVPFSVIACLVKPTLAYANTYVKMDSVEFEEM